MELKRSKKKCPKLTADQGVYCDNCIARLEKPKNKQKCTGPKTKTVAAASPAKAPSPARTHKRATHEGVQYLYGEIVHVAVGSEGGGMEQQQGAVEKKRHA
jgi:hypothetical protein